LNKEIEEARKQIGERKSLETAFIECNLQLGAHVLAQCVSYHEVGAGLRVGIMEC
jgi:calcium permeable stress-gated cation channel